MNISRCHIAFWQARALPSFAVRFYAQRAKNYPRTLGGQPKHETRAGLIDECVNAHAAPATRRNLDAANFVALLNLWRANKHQETLAEYLRYLWHSDTNIGRANIAGRMLRKLERK